MSERDIPRTIPRPSYPRKRVAEFLGIDVEAVRRLGDQGRLEVSVEDGEECYEVTSAYRFKAEELIRATLDRAKKECPELCVQIEELLSLQYQRGRLDGTFRAGDKNHDLLLDLYETVREEVRERRGSTPKVRAS